MKERKKFKIKTIKNERNKQQEKKELKKER